jgi:hypothetical protein
MASKKRIQIDLLALGFAAATMALFADRPERPNLPDSKYLSHSQARAESALYLESAVSDVRLHRAAERWQATDGKATAWLDARTGELIEIELEPAR